MRELVLQGDPAITIRLRSGRRVRRMTLRVSRLDGRVTMSVPAWAGSDAAERFAREKEPWIRRQLSGAAQPVVPRPGGEIAFEGRMVAIVPGTGRSVRLEGDRILCPGPAETAPARLAGFLKVAARERLVAASDRHAAALGRQYTRLTLRDTRSRWGSCSAEGTLMYSWRLIMAPPAVLDYVAAHEVAHLVEMNHAPAYWEVVARICPDFRAHRAWLRRNGPALHRYRFAD